MMTMTKVFCMFLCLGCAVAQSSDDELDMALVNAPVVLGNSTDTPSTDTESDGTGVAQSSSDEEEQAQCDQCDNEGPAGKFTECDGCGDIVCDDCRECGEDCFVCRDAESGADSTTRLTNNVYAAKNAAVPPKMQQRPPKMQQRPPETQQP